jgi:hypothetical protein
MARPITTGLTYFPFDVDFFNDDKVELISSEFGAKGEVVIIRLLCLIYRNGYFYQWGKDESLLFAKRVGLDCALVNEVVNGLVKRSFFNEGVFNSFNILTSKGIQCRYIEAKKRAKSTIIITEYSLTDENVTLMPLNVTSIPKEKESKEKESKVKKSIYASDADFKIFMESFWPVSEITHFKNFVKITDCCAAQISKNRFEYFKIQCENYKKFIELIGLRYKTNYEKFLGKQENCFDDGIWNSENWEQKIIDRSTPEPGKVQSNRGPAAIITAFDNVQLNQS